MIFNTNERRTRGRTRNCPTARHPWRRIMCICWHILCEREKKDKNLFQREIVKKQKDVQVSNKVGLIAAGLRNKQMQINNGKFNQNMSLEALSVFVIIHFVLICYSPFSCIIYLRAMI
jgi:hypothetical protein